MGGFVIPQIIPHNFRVRIDLLDCDVGFRSIPAFEPFYALDTRERIAALKDLEWRRRLVSEVESLPEGTNRAFFFTALPRFTISDVGQPEMQLFVGQKLSEIAADRGQTLLETIFDLAADAKLEIGFQSNLVPVATEQQRALRKRILRDERLMLGASDGGAHVLSVINVEYSTASFRELVEEEEIFTLEELVQEFTEIPAKLYGMIDRGRLAEGCAADIVIFDEKRMSSSAIEMRRDFPGDAPHLYNYGEGIHAVIVAGRVIVQDGAFTDERPGRVLRSGRDTKDVAWDEMLKRNGRSRV